MIHPITINIIKFSDIQILESWAKNASPWIQAVQEKQVVSRRLVIDPHDKPITKSICKA